MFSVYILKSQMDGRYYYGQTSDLQKRVNEHNSGMSGYTSKYIPWDLVYKEEYMTRSEAMKRENFFKSTTGRRYLISMNIISGAAEINPPVMED